MSMYERLMADMKSALKGGDACRLSVIRMVIAALKMVELEKEDGKLSDDDAIRVIQRHVKQRKESIAQFINGARQDLANKEEGELRILEEYLPEQLSEDELKMLVKTAITETGSKTKQDVGKVMKCVMIKAQGRADGKEVNKVAISMLA